MGQIKVLEFVLVSSSCLDFGLLGEISEIYKSDRFHEVDTGKEY